MVTTWPDGFGWPCILLKLRFSGEALMMGSAGGGAGWTATVSVLCPAAKVSAPLYLPGASPLIFTATEVAVFIAPFNWPLEGVADSQPTDGTACQVTIEPSQLFVSERFKV